MPALKAIRILGYRGFRTEQTVPFAIPSGSYGSGLTYLLGSNNAGKSSIVECLTAVTRRQPPSFTEGRRNKSSGDRVTITIVNTDDESKALKSVPSGGSESQWDSEDIQPNREQFLVVPSRRQFQPLFGKGTADRTQYSTNQQFEAQRGGSINFERRLFTIQNYRSKFDDLLSRVVYPVPDWYIDQNDSGQYYLKFKSGDNFHTSDGMGEGLVSLFVLIDAFYDSSPGDIIVIDEPELSLHPQYQRRLIRLISEFSQDRQIIVATHSPLMLDWKAVLGGAQVVRVFQRYDSSSVAYLGEETRAVLNGFLNDTNNPHVLGLDASEVFFLDDQIVLAEGQEDVVFLRKIIDETKLKFQPNFFGWGVGGAGKMRAIAKMFQELKYQRVVGVLDADMQALRDQLEQEFPDYKFRCIPANDIRTKQARPALPEKEGLLDETGSIRNKYWHSTYKLMLSLRSDVASDA